MKLAYRLILAIALLAIFPEYSAAISEAEPYILLFSSNVAGETEPCG